MRLRVIVEPTLTLKEEDKVLNFGEEFEVEEARGIEILKATFNGRPVVEFVSSNELPLNDETLAAEKAELAAKVQELTELNASLTAEKAELEAKVQELTSKIENKKGKGEDK